MTIALTTPITGSAQSGFTAPTYILTADTASDVNGKQWAVTAVGGTQAGVTPHTASSPFTWTYWRPKLYRVLGKPNPVTGLITNVPKNIHRVNVIKGMSVAPNQPVQLGYIKAEIGIPSGAESYDAPNVRAMLSAFIGGITQVSSGAGDTLVTGIIG